MTREQKETTLSMLKVDLGILSATAYDTRLGQLLDAAADAVSRMGAALDLSSISDQELVVEYAAWLWRRRDSHAAMGEGLRFRLHNRIFSEKARGPSQAPAANETEGS